MRMRSILACLILLGCQSVALAERNTRIIAGEDAPENAYPWMVGIHETGDNQSYCGGSLIHPQWVLTAAHCLDNKAGTRILAPNELFVVVSAYDYREWETKAIRAEVEQVIQHDGWRGRNDVIFPDIGLVKLQDPITTVEPLSVVSDRDSNLFNTGNVATVMGWGRLSASARVYPDILQQVQVPLVDSGVCQKAYQTEEIILPYSICAGYAEGKKDSCVGDSGGPLVIQDEAGQWQQLGIVSYGGKENGPICAGENAYGVYTQPAAFTDFIEQYVPKLYDYQGIWQSPESFDFFTFTTTPDYMALMILTLEGKWLAFTGANAFEKIELEGQFSVTGLKATLTPIDDSNAELEILCEESDCPLPQTKYSLSKSF
ncbi:serine protease [Candidatus Albibeggiatoa sp. nov. NOAA]|uniref:S1 family peptidase n=1 Tax=Candidatus Albibeggiatoa sp. nov. NOAA TaxID=3162724 RepID=UPI0032FE75D5|nr:serine protease [Thiotrichaceae bacterium]